MSISPDATSAGTNEELPSTSRQNQDSRVSESFTVEKIDRAAIRHNGDVYVVLRPGRHHHIIRDMHARGLSAKATREQGFVTTTGRFVDRREAAAIAKAAGQIKEKTGPDDVLFSEDVW